MESLSFVKARDVPGVLVQVTCDVMLPIMLLHIVLGVTCARDVFFYCAERKIVLTEGQARATSNWFVLGCVPQPTAGKTSWKRCWGKIITLNVTSHVMYRNLSGWYATCCRPLSVLFQTKKKILSFSSFTWPCIRPFKCESTGTSVSWTETGDVIMQHYI